MPYILATFISQRLNRAAVSISNKPSRTYGVFAEVRPSWHQEDVNATRSRGRIVLGKAEKIKKGSYSLGACVRGWVEARI